MRRVTGVMEGGTRREDWKRRALGVLGKNLEQFKLLGIYKGDPS